MTATQFGSVKASALAEYFKKDFNLIGADAEYTKNRPTLKAIPLDRTKLTLGDGFYETLKIGQGWSGSVDWETGNKYHAPSTRVRWAITDPYAQYGRITFDSLTLNRYPLGALIDLKGTEAQDVKESMLNTCERELWNAGDGFLGQIDTLGGSEATRILTLKDPAQVFNFQHGMHFRGATTQTGGTVHSDVYKVTDFDPIAGTVTATQITNTGGQELTDEDYLHVVANYDVEMPGITTFIPSSSPSDTLYGVARTGNPALSGWRFPFVMSISDTIKRAFSQMGQWVNRDKDKFVVVLSTADWLDLADERESRIQEDPGAMQKWGLSGLVVRTSFGPITCISIPQVPDGRGYILDFSTWKLYTIGNLPHVIDEDGLMMVRGGIGTVSGNEYLNGDMFAMQLRMWKILLCLQPLSNATFPTVAS
jgi:hypothetical protein